MEEDMILPDDYVEPAPQDSEPSVETQDEALDSLDADTTGEDTKPPVEAVEAQQEPVTQPQTVKIKFNHEEREIPLEEAALLAQKGMVFDKAVERARQEAAQQARDAVIAEMGMTWNGKPITTEAEYKRALQEKELIDKYKDRDLPPEVIQELLESRRDREERQREKAAREQEAKIQAEYNDFISTFQSLNERPFDPNKDKIPQEVWDAVDKGQPLKYAYLEHYNKELRNQLRIAKQNEVNTKKAPVGSVTAGGGTKVEAEDDFLAGFNSI
jgi:DNA-binding transcriptional MerR regulator